VDGDSALIAASEGQTYNTKRSVAQDTDGVDLRLCRSKVKETFFYYLDAEMAVDWRSAVIYIDDLS